MDNPLQSKVTRKLNRRRLIMFTTATAVLSALLAFACAEAFVRMRMARRPNDIEALRRFHRHEQSGEKTMLIHFVRPSENPRLIYELIPGAEGNFKDAHVKINRDGFFDVERQTTAPATTWRIALLGDSIAFGWGVSMEKRFGNRLENYLNMTTADEPSSAPRFEVLNFAVPGYNTVMEAELLKTRIIGKYAINALILCFVYDNDAALPNFVSKPRPLYTLRRSYLLEGLRAGRRSNDLEAGVQYMDPREIPEEYKWMIGWKPARAALKEISSITNRLGTNPFFIMEYYSVEPWRGPNAVPLTKDPATDVLGYVEEAGYQIADPKPELIRLLDKHKLPSTALWIAPDDTPPDAHPTPARHAVYARALYEKLVQAGALPDADRRKGVLDADLELWNEIIEAEMPSRP